MSNVVDLFERIRIIDLTNDANIIELVRLTGKSCSPSFLTPRLPAIATVVFTRRSPAFPILQSWLFSVFFESFQPLLEPPIFSEILALPCFLAAFESIAAGYAGKPFKHFVKVVASTRTDVSALVLAHFDNLITGHIPATIRLSQSSGIALDDAQYTALTAAVVQRCASATGAVAASKSLLSSLQFVGRLSRERALLSVAPIASCLVDLLAAVASPTFARSAGALAALLVSLAGKAPELARAIDAAAELLLGDPDAFSWRVAALRLRVLEAMGKGAEEAAEAIVARLRGAGAAVAEIDCFGKGERALLARLLQCEELSGAAAQVLGRIAEAEEPRAVVAAVEAAAEKWGEVRAGLEKLAVILPVKQGVRGELIEAARMGGRMEALRKEWGDVFPCVFGSTEEEKAESVETIGDK